jgi:heme A synthase
MVCGSALAQSAYGSGGGAGTFGHGIPVYWPYHALLMATGCILLIAGFIVARFHKTTNWYKNHMILQTTGGACIIAGLFIGIYMVTLSGLPNFHNIHEISGGIIGILLVITIILGYSIKRANTAKKVISTIHRLLGRISLVLIVINIFLGLLFLSIILRR